MKESLSQEAPCFIDPAFEHEGIAQVVEQGRTRRVERHCLAEHDDCSVMLRLPRQGQPERVQDIGIVGHQMSGLPISVQRENVARLTSYCRARAR